MNEIEGVEGARNFFADLKRSCLSILEMNHINYFVQKDNDILNIVYYFSVPLERVKFHYKKRSAVVKRKNLRM